MQETSPSTQVVFEIFISFQKALRVIEKERFSHRQVLTWWWGAGGAVASAALKRGNIRRTAV